MDIDQGIINVSRIELNNAKRLMVINGMAEKALTRHGIMMSPDDMRSPATLAEDYGLLVVTEEQNKV